MNFFETGDKRVSLLRDRRFGSWRRHFFNPRKKFGVMTFKIRRQIDYEVDSKL
jgi:hypothetical protein